MPSRDEAFVLWLALIVGLFGNAPAASEARLGFIGDVSFAGRTDLPGAIFDEVAAALRAPDVMVANVEGLLIVGGAPAYGEARLDISASPRWAATFAGSGIDLLGVANNHAWDAGARGVLENLTHVGGQGVPVFGSGTSAEAAFAARRFETAAGCVSFVPATLKSNRRPKAGAFVAYYGPRGAREIAELERFVAAERAAGCAPIVSIHWGREAKPLPDPQVVAVGHALVAAGAVLVVGHHPHVLQGVEWRDGPHGRAAIAWSLGNFVFKNRDPDKRRTGLLEVVVTRRDGDGVARVSEVALRPMTIDVRTFRPRRATAGEADEHARVMAKRSAPFGTVVQRDGERLVFSRR